MTKDYRTGGFGPHIDHAGHLRLRVQFGDPADEDWTGISSTPAGVAQWLRELAGDIEQNRIALPGPLDRARPHSPSLCGNIHACDNYNQVWCGGVRIITRETGDRT